MTTKPTDRADSPFDCTECDRPAVGLIKVDGETLYLCRAHYRDGLEDYADVMTENRLLPVGDPNAE